MTEPHITFESRDGKELLLGGVAYDVDIDGLLATTTIAQYYSNPYDTNIEAVYTFPLSAQAVLLGIEITINERVLKGTIKEKSKAEAEYETAIDEGNRAIMVEKRSEGIYTVNIANILPKDRISIRIEYTELLEWRQDQVKWLLPTTIAPKYGDAGDMNLDDVTDPAISLFAENRFSFRMSVKGVLADSKINTPSHQIVVEQGEEETSVVLKNETDFMNRDIVFTFKTQRAREERSFVLTGRDFKGVAAIASFYPSFGEDLPKEPKSVTFVVDCSGSMMGVSIESARTALSKALNLLSEEDSFNIVKFGTHHTALFNHEVPATKENLNIAKRMVRSLDADMGGTNMENALQSAYAGHKPSKEKKGYLFLITDGEIYDHKGVINRAKQSEMAHFVVGVGYASDDPLLRSIASETRGSYENVDPNERMDDYILHLFKKIDTPKARDIQVQWPGKPTIEHLPNVVFDGDTLYAYATFDKAIVGEVTLHYTLENSNRYSTSVAMSAPIESEEIPSVVARQVIAKEIEALNAKRPQRYHYEEETQSEESQRIIELSTQYQLFSELTNYILVNEVTEEEKPVDLPQMQRVENMMVMESGVMAHEDMGVLGLAPSASMRMSLGVECSSSEDILSVPTFLRTQMDGEDTQAEKRKKELVKHADASENILFDELSDTQSSTIDISLESIWDRLDPEKYEQYLLYLNDWFVKHSRLPRKKEELMHAGFDKEIAECFENASFRKQIKALTVALYEVCGDCNAYDKAFIAYIETRLMKRGWTDKILGILGL